MLEMEPNSVSPVLSSYVERLDDCWPERRQRALASYLPSLAGTQHDGMDAMRKRIVQFAAVELAVPWVRAAGLDAEADSLAILTSQLTPELVSTAAAEYDARAALEASLAARHAAHALHQVWMDEVNSAALSKLVEEGVDIEVAKPAATQVGLAINSAKNAVFTTAVAVASAAAVAARADHAASYAGMVLTERGVTPDAVVATSLEAVNGTSVDWRDLDRVRGVVYRHHREHRTIRLPAEGVDLAIAQDATALDLLARLVEVGATP